MRPARLMQLRENKEPGGGGQRGRSERKSPPTGGDEQDRNSVLHATLERRISPEDALPHHRLYHCQLRYAVALRRRTRRGVVAAAAAAAAPGCAEREQPLLLEGKEGLP